MDLRTRFIFENFYCLVAFFSLWRLSRLINMPLYIRRAVFCLLGTLLLAPILVPAALTAIYVPNGVLMLITLDSGVPIWQIFDLYRVLPQVAFPSLGVTATILALIAWRLVKSEARPTGNRWVTIALPAILLFGVFQAYRYEYPDTDIPSELTNAVVEEAYGALFDEVADLLLIAEREEQRAEIARLKSVFAADPAIVSAVLYEPGQSSIVGRTFSYSKERKSRQGISCVNQVKKHRNRLSRCTGKYGRFDRIDLLGYRHPYTLGEESSSVVVYFEYDAAIDMLLD